MKKFFLLMILFISLAFNSPALAESTAGTLPHATDFLTLPNGPGGTTWYPRANSTDRAKARQELKNRGYKHLYLSVVSSDHNYYGNPSGFKIFLQELNNDGIKPVVWLTSDTGTWKDQPVSTIKSVLVDFIPKIDSLVNSYCLGIEIDEYWTESEADEVGNQLDALTDKPIAVHQLPNAWGYCKGYCDYLIFQYGFGKTESQIKTLTTSVINSLGRPVVGGEYNLDRSDESLSIRLGNAAVSAGASGFGNGGASAIATDTNLPSTPTGLTAAAVSSSRIDLAWSAATDNVGVTGYRIYRCTGIGCTPSTQVTTADGTTYSNTGLAANTAYTYRVAAYDAAGNISAQSTSVSAVTKIATDTNLPSTPTGLTAAAVSSSRIDLAWSAATDNVGVTGYRIYRCTGIGCTPSTQVTTADGTTYSNTGLAANTAYTYRVAAYDAAGNISAQSTSVSAVTPGSALIINLSVKDTTNLADWSVRMNMGEGDLMFGDRGFTLSSIPSFLEGADWIRTANDSKSYIASPLATFTSGGSLTAYLAHDDRIAAKPSWLSEWQDSGENIVDSEGLYFSVYTKNYSSGTTVILGPNVSSSASADLSMYSVAVKTRVVSAKKGDLNADNKVDVTDLGIFLANWGMTTKPASDINQDGKVDVTDLGILLGNWG